MCKWMIDRTLKGTVIRTLSTIEALRAARLNIIFLVETICPDYTQLLREFHKNVRQDSLLD